MTECRAASVRFGPDQDAIEIKLTDGARVRVRKATIEEFRDVMLARCSSFSKPFEAV